MNRLSQPKVWVALFALFLFLLVGFALWLILTPSSAAPSSKVVLIKKGSSLRKISETLEKEGVIRSKRLFMGLATLLGKKTRMKAGEYDLHTGMLPLEVLDILVKGQVKKHLVTIAEGLTLAQIAQLLEDLNVVDGKSFLQKATSPPLISSLGLSEVAASTLEGYLFPETYYMIKEMEPEEVIQMMVQQFKKVFTPELMSRNEPSGITQREAVILASIIEKETALPEEKPLVSAVFHNRLKRGIPLQSDPTVIYGIKNFNGNLTREDLMKPSPYNTYLLNGLPPTPICNPGKESLLAAISPARVPFLYFVSKNDGSHFFSSDFEEHNRAVGKYQKNVRKNDLTRK